VKMAATEYWEKSTAGRADAGNGTEQPGLKGFKDCPPT